MTAVDGRVAPQTPVSAPASTVSAPQYRPSRRLDWKTIRFHGLMIPLALVWVMPIVFVALVAVRNFDDIARNGLMAWPRSFDLSSFSNAWQDGQGRALWNSIVVTVPAVVLTLFMSSLAAYALSRYAIPFRRGLLLLMLAGNLLPPQMLLFPVAQMSESLGIYDTRLALVLLHVGFGLGFYTFVLHGFMRSIPDEITDAAKIDGAGPFRIYSRIIMPLTRPALAALSALATTWIFNDLLFSITVLRSETKMPTTATLLNMQGAYVSTWNNLAAASLIAAIPTALVFFAFQRHFVSGLLVGSSR